MRSDRLYNYFEIFNIYNDSVFILCFIIFTFILMSTTYFVINYLYKKCCTNKIPLYIESKKSLTDELIISCE
jgi:hypothetical protein